MRSWKPQGNKRSALVVLSVLCCWCLLGVEWCSHVLSLICDGAALFEDYHDFVPPASTTSYNMKANGNKEKKVGPLTLEQVFKREEEVGVVETTSGPRIPPENAWLLNNNNTIPSPETSTASIIPSLLHKVYIQKNGQFPDTEVQVSQHHQRSKPKKEAARISSLRQAHNSWKENNPNYDIRYYDLKRCRFYLETHFHPVFLRAFDCIQAFSGKANIFRMAVVYREGGWYSDWKQECLVPRLLDRLSSATTTSNDTAALTPGMVAFWDRGNPFSRKNKCVQTSIFGALPKHPIVAETLRFILWSVQQERYGLAPISDTGPCVFGAAFKSILRKQQPDQRLPRISMGEHYGGMYHHDFANGSSLESRGRRVVIRSKCQGCGNGQDWGAEGNNYNTMHNKKTYYCQEARSLLL